jgi:hypothetical protein
MLRPLRPRRAAAPVTVTAPAPPLPPPPPARAAARLSKPGPAAGPAGPTVPAALPGPCAARAPVNLKCLLDSGASHSVLPEPAGPWRPSSHDPPAGAPRRPRGQPSRHHPCAAVPAAPPPRRRRHWQADAVTVGSSLGCIIPAGTSRPSLAQASNLKLIQVLSSTSLA